MEVEMSRRFNEGTKMIRGLDCLCRTRGLSILGKVGLMEGTVTLSVLYGSDSWVLNVREGEELKCLTSSA